MKATVDDGTPDIVVYPTDRDAYGRLCALLTRGNRRAPKGECHLQFTDLLEHSAGQLMIIMPDVKNMQSGQDLAIELNRAAPYRVWIGAKAQFLGNDRARLNRIRAMCDAAGVPMLAHNDVLYHQPDRSIVLDVLTCIRLGLTVETAGRNMQPNDVRHIAWKWQCGCPSIARRSTRPSVSCR